jgi:hypothetical protein
MLPDECPNCGFLDISYLTRQEWEEAGEDEKAELAVDTYIDERDRGGEV